MQPTRNQQKGIKFLQFSKTSIGDNNLVAAVDGQKIYVLGLALSVDGGANTAVFHDTGGVVARSPLWNLAAKDHVEIPVTPSDRAWFETAEGTGLDLVLTAATAVSGMLIYQQF